MLAEIAKIFTPKRTRARSAEMLPPTPVVVPNLAERTDVSQWMHHVVSAQPPEPAMAVHEELSIDDRPRGAMGKRLPPR